MIFFLLHSTTRMADRCMIERDIHRESESTNSRSKLSVKENSLTLQKKREREPLCGNCGSCGGGDG